MVGDAGIEPAWSRLRGECISHLCQSPSNNWCRKKESNFRRAIIGRVLGLRAIPAIYWCAVRESNPHLLVVGQLFSSIELPAQKLGERTVSAVARELSRGCRSETLRSPLINGAGCRNRTCFVSLKRRVHSRICQSRALKPGKRTVSAVARTVARAQQRTVAVPSN